LPGEIDIHNLVENSYVNVLFFAKDFRSAGDQAFGFVDNLADIVRDSSSRIGCMRAALKYNDIQIGAPPASLGSGAHPRSISADDNQSLFGHINSLPLKCSCPIWDYYFALCAPR
jgi:hypothetical protein